METLPPSRVIIHADVDAFYASVEQRDNPELRGRPLAVGGSPDHRGVVMTASYEARKFGVRSAMPSRTAVRLCPNLVLVPARFDAYHRDSNAIMAIFQQRATRIEPLSLDEAFLDVSEMVTDFDDACERAHAIKTEVLKQTKLTISLGVATTKLVAKIASDFEKPDGLTAVRPEDARTFLAPLPVRRLWGIGPKTEEVLKAAGIGTVGELAGADDSRLLRRLGAWAIRWKLLAQGLDDRAVSTHRDTKQMSREITFDRDTSDGEKLRQTLAHMARGLAAGIEHTGAARTVHIKIRYSDFQTLTRQRQAGVLVTADDITTHARELLERCWTGQPVRLIGLGLSNFVTTARDQLSLFIL